MIIEIPASHPRAQSLNIREKLVQGYEHNIVAAAGLIAHGRGEAFDYLIGEKTNEPAQQAISTAAALLLQARHPIISVNGNTAVLVPEAMVKLAALIPAALEINLFYRSLKRERAIEKMLFKAGAKKVLGVGKQASARAPELESERGRVDIQGIYKADVVLVSLEDGDRTEYLVKMGKRVIAIDLNPLSRTAQRASVSIVDNVVRVLPAIIKEVTELKGKESAYRLSIIEKYSNKKILRESLEYINRYLKGLAKQGVVQNNNGS